MKDTLKNLFWTFAGWLLFVSFLSPFALAWLIVLIRPDWFWIVVGFFLISSFLVFLQSEVGKKLGA